MYEEFEMETSMQDYEGLTSAELLAMTTDVVCAYVANNEVTLEAMPEVMHTIYSTLSDLNKDPAVAINKSITDDYIVCLEDGKQLKMLKRHLKTSYNLTPEQYRERWGLPSDYPMVAPNYAKQRSSLAVKIGLGRKRKKIEQQAA